MRTLLRYISFAEYELITRGNTKAEIDSLVWCVQHMLESERRPYLQQLIDISKSAVFLNGVQRKETVAA